MSYRLVACSSENNQWNHLLSSWRSICEEYDEDFDTYAAASFSVLKELANAPSKNAKVYVLCDDKNNALVMFQANVTPLPGFVGKVLRVRHLTFSPVYDYNSLLPIDDYKKVLSEVFAQATYLTKNEMQADHIKFHFKTPADLYFFKEIRPSLEREKEFCSVRFYGAWLALSFSQTAHAD